MEKGKMKASALFVFVLMFVALFILGSFSFDSTNTLIIGFVDMFVNFLKDLVDAITEFFRKLTDGFSIGFLCMCFFV